MADQSPPFHATLTGCSGNGPPTPTTDAGTYTVTATPATGMGAAVLRIEVTMTAQ
jgi:hypothetical protein